MKTSKWIAAFATVAAVAFTSFTPASTALAAAPAISTQVRGTPVTRIRAQVNLNIRSGPGTRFARIGMLRPGETRVVTGISDDRQWWRVWCEDGTGWVSANAFYSQPVAWRH